MRDRLWHTRRVVLASLECHELVDRAPCLSVAGADVELRSPRQVAGLVGDERPARRHGLCAGHFAQVDHRRRREVARLEGEGDLTHVRADTGDARGIVEVTLQLDAPAVLESVEVMSGRILVDAHRRSPAVLHRTEGGVMPRGRHLLTVERDRQRKHCDDAEGYAIHDERSAWWVRKNFMARTAAAAGTLVPTRT